MTQYKFLNTYNFWPVPHKICLEAFGQDTWVTLPIVWADTNPQRLNNLFVSPEAMEDIRNWGGHGLCGE
jgi:hypothetical protein